MKPLAEATYQGTCGLNCHVTKMYGLETAKLALALRAPEPKTH